MPGWQGLRSRLYQPFHQLYRHPAPVLSSWCSTPSAHTIQVPLGYRMVATSKHATRKRGPNIPSVFKVRTLCPERLEAVGQKVIDMSGKLKPCVPIHNVDTRTLQFAYGYEAEASGRYRLVPYPEGTRGVFYYYRPTEGPEFSAGVRFRICDSAAGFKSGRDLLGTRGDVWGRKVLELVKHQNLKGFLALCRAEQLIDEVLISDIDKLDLSGKVQQYQQYLLSDPFVLNLATFKKQFTYVTRAKVVRLGFPENAFLAANHDEYFPLTGSFKAQFELSSLPEHKEFGPTLVVRVLDIVDPIVRHPGYDGVAPVPVPGTLLQRILYGQLRVLAIPLQRQQMAEDLLALAKTTWG